MSATATTALVTAGLLGVTHAVEPDHVAGISSVTSEFGDSRLSALAGACFSLGHVVLVVVWLVVGSIVLGRSSFPATFDAVGTVSVGVVLGLLGAALAVTGLRRAVSTDEHDHGDVTHGHPHVALPIPGFGRHAHGRGHGTLAYLKTGVVGALFTLSPPISMIAFATTLLPAYGTPVVTLAVVTYGVTITVTMSLLGAGVGALFDLTRERSAALHGGTQALAGLVVVALALSVLVNAVPVL
jgi:nickel/cobalt exporter